MNKKLGVAPSKVLMNSPGDHQWEIQNLNKNKQNPPRQLAPNCTANLHPSKREDPLLSWSLPPPAHSFSPIYS